MRCVVDTFRGAFTVTFGEASKSPRDLHPSDAEPLVTQAALTLDGEELGFAVESADGAEHPASATATATDAEAAATRMRRRDGIAGTANSLKAWGCRDHPPPGLLGARCAPRGWGCSGAPESATPNSGGRQRDVHLCDVGYACDTAHPWRLADLVRRTDRGHRGDGYGQIDDSRLHAEVFRGDLMQQVDEGEPERRADARQDLARRLFAAALDLREVGHRDVRGP